MKSPIGTVVPWLCMAAMNAQSGPAPVVINPDGAWCWFQDERALMLGANKVAVASITGDGDVQVTTWNLSDGTTSIATLHENFEADDHNVPGMMIRDDGRILALYAKHHREPRMYYRVSTNPLDATAWDPEQSYDVGVTDPFTYANPFQLPAEDNRIYNFWRAIDFNPTYSFHDPVEGEPPKWSTGANHIYYVKGDRPYVKYASNGHDTIHFAFTEAHPDRPVQTSLYHAFYRNGTLYTSRGVAVRELSKGPIRPSEATKVYDGVNSPNGKAWVWDIALDPEGRPVIAYTSHPAWDDIRYRYARWNGTAWEDRQIAFAGTRLYETQEFYAGGICIDPDDVNVVYLSSDVDIATGARHGSGRYEIYKGITRDAGRSWEWTPITILSAKDNLRPIVPAGHPGKTFVLWFRGTYTSYTNYETEVVGLLRD